MSTETFEQAAKRIYHDWDQALSNDDVDALQALYAR
jgi:ketosteroid isomerase-like protein